MFFKIKAGTTSRSIPIRVQDSTSTTGALLSGLTASSSGLTCKYRRQGQAVEQTVSLIAVGVTLDTYTPGGFIPDTILAGHYELQIPNAALQTGATYVVITLHGAANMVPVAILIELDAVDYQVDAFGALKPTSSGRTLDVTANGNAGIDLGNVDNPTASLALSNTTISVGQQVGSVSGNVGGSVGSVIGNVGGNVNGSVGSLATFGFSVTVSTGSVNAIAGQVWDEVLTGATHNVSSSAGRRLRQIASSIVYGGTAQGPGTGNNQIQLDTGASATNGAYDPSLIAIEAGTGAGQTRLILQYVGSTRTATVDRDWRINPDSTSEFVILGDAGRESVNEGLAQGGTSASITLNASASATDDAYNGQLVFIRSGTGQDQVAMVEDYVGSTKVATIRTRAASGQWATTPNTTSAYVMIPNLTFTVAEIQSGLATTTQLTSVETKTDTISNKLGSFAGAGVNTVLGFFRALMRKDNGITIPSDIGGAFTNTTDSVEAIRDRGDDAWATGGGAGGVVNITVEDRSITVT